MSDGLMVLAAGAAKLGDADRDALIRGMRELVQDIENLYRPARAMMPSGSVGADPVLLALYGARDSLIEAENCILRLYLEPANEKIDRSGPGSERRHP